MTSPPMCVDLPRYRATPARRAASRDDRRLADAGVAADEHDRGQPLARIRDRPFEDVQLRAPPDEVGSCQAGGHGPPSIPHRRVDSGRTIPRDSGSEGSWPMRTPVP